MQYPFKTRQVRGQATCSADVEIVKTWLICSISAPLVEHTPWSRRGSLWVRCHAAGLVSTTGPREERGSIDEVGRGTSFTHARFVVHANPDDFVKQAEPGIYWVPQPWHTAAAFLENLGYGDV